MNAQEEHLSVEVMEKYLARELTGEEMFSVDRHMGNCVECAAKVRDLRNLNFAFNRWTAKAHGEAYREAIQYNAELKEKRWKRLIEIYDHFFEVLGEVPNALRRQLKRILECEWVSIEAGELEAANMRKHILNDALFSFVSLGVTPHGPETDPFFYTALRKPPTELTFDLMEAGRYIVTIYVDKEKEFTETVIARGENGQGIFKWPKGIQVASGREYIWRVQPIIADSAKEEYTIAGKFWLATEENIKKLDAMETQCANLKGEPIRAVALATLYQEARLYDAAIRNLLNTINRDPADPITIPMRRALGNIYQAVHGEVLSENLRMFDNILDWISEHGKEQLKLIYCLLLSNYERYKRGECKNCNECGLIK